jgi:hypothetical protein
MFWNIFFVGGNFCVDTFGSMVFRKFAHRINIAYVKLFISDLFKAIFKSKACRAIPMMALHSFT